MKVSESVLGQVGFINLSALLLALACFGRASQRDMKSMHRWTITQIHRYKVMILGVAFGTPASGYLVQQYGCTPPTSPCARSGRWAAADAFSWPCWSARRSAR